MLDPIAIAFGVGVLVGGAVFPLLWRWMDDEPGDRPAVWKIEPERPWPGPPSGKDSP